MAFTYGFYNSLNGDRRYKAEDFGTLVGSLISDGVFENIGSKLFVTAGTGMDINVGTGKAWFDNTWSVNDSVMVVTVPQSDITRPRYDTVVLEVNTDISVRENKIKIVSGSPAVTPTKPVLVNTDKIHQHPLAHILVPAAATSITASNIEIVVGQTVCPFCTGILQKTDITDLYNQWQADFESWFQNLKDQLTSNVVTNLQAQIDALGVSVQDKVAKADKATASDFYPTRSDSKWVTPKMVTNANMANYYDIVLSTNDLQTDLNDINTVFYPCKSTNYISAAPYYLKNQVYISKTDPRYQYVSSSGDWVSNIIVMPNYMYYGCRTSSATSLRYNDGTVKQLNIRADFSVKSNSGVILALSSVSGSTSSIKAIDGNGNVTNRGSITFTNGDNYVRYMGYVNGVVFCLGEKSIYISTNDGTTFYSPTFTMRSNDSYIFAKFSHNYGNLSPITYTNGAYYLAVKRYQNSSNYVSIYKSTDLTSFTYWKESTAIYINNSNAADGAVLGLGKYLFVSHASSSSNTNTIYLDIIDTTTSSKTKSILSTDISPSGGDYLAVIEIVESKMFIFGFNPNTLTIFDSSNGTFQDVPFDYTNFPGRFFYYHLYDSKSKNIICSAASSSANTSYPLYVLDTQTYRVRKVGNYQINQHMFGPFYNGVTGFAYVNSSSSGTAYPLTFINTNIKPLPDIECGYIKVRASDIVTNIAPVAISEPATISNLSLISALID